MTRTQFENLKENDVVMNNNGEVIIITRPFSPNSNTVGGIHDPEYDEKKGDYIAEGVENPHLTFNDVRRYE